LLSSYRDLKVWQKGMELAVQCYQITSDLPASERFGLTSQIRRAAASIPANIAEGRARNHTKEFVQFLYIAHGSLAELETHLILGLKLKYFSDEIVGKMLGSAAEIGKMLNGLINSLSGKESVKRCLDKE
jgi:four helix bundle protein